jgi:hypothetical protein
MTRLSGASSPPPKMKISFPFFRFIARTKAPASSETSCTPAERISFNVRENT